MEVLEISADFFAIRTFTGYLVSSDFVNFGRFPSISCRFVELTLPIVGNINRYLKRFEEDGKSSSSEELADLQMPE